MRIEALESNMAGMNRSIVIGLGGTGQREALRLKQRLISDARFALLATGQEQQLFGPGETDWIRSQGVAVIGLDAAAQDIPHVGQALTLDRAAGENPVLNMATVMQVFNHVHDVPDHHEQAQYQSLRSWLSHDDVQDLTVQWGDIAGGVGLAQMRWFGRLVLTVDDQRESTLNKSIDRALRIAQAAGQGQLQVFIVASVAGGTGAGLLIDTVMRINKKYAGPLRQQVNVVGMLVLPDAFEGVLEATKIETAKANGFATMRELDRLMNKHELVRVADNYGGPDLELSQPAFDSCYLVGGSRSTGQALNLTESTDIEVPVALGDAIYACVFPSTGSNIREVAVNNIQFTVNAKLDNRFATFGIHTVLYDWDFTWRSLSLRFATELVDELTQDTREAQSDAVREFARGGSFIAQPRGDNAQQGMFKLASLSLGTGELPLCRFDPSWIEPSDLDLVATPTPTVNMRTEATEIAELSTRTTGWENSDLVTWAHGRHDENVDEPGRVDRFVGKATDDWNADDLSRNSYRAYLNHCSERSLSEWRECLYEGVTWLMGRNDCRGGLRRGLAFLEEAKRALATLGGRLDGFSRDYDLEQLKNAMDDLRQQVDNKGPLGFIKWDDARLQIDYLEATQAWLDASSAEWSLQQAQLLLGRMQEVVEQVRADGDVYLQTLLRFSAEAAQERSTIDDARRKETETSMRTLVPQPGDPREQRLYLSELGGGDPGTGLPAGLLTVLRRLSWNWKTVRGEIRILLRGVSQSSEPEPADDWPTLLEFRDIRSFGREALEGLSRRSVFDVLEQGLSKEEIQATAQSLAKKWVQAASPLLSMDAVGQVQAHADGDSTLQGATERLKFVAAKWVEAGSGSAMSKALRTALGARGDAGRIADLQKFETTDSVGVRTTETVDVAYPVNDKIVLFDGEYLLRLPGFLPLTLAQAAYESKKAGGGPSIHVLPEEKVAAELEHRSKALADRRVISEALPMLTPAQVGACRDRDFLVDLAWCAAAGLICWDMPPDDAGGDYKLWLLQDGDGGVAAVLTHDRNATDFLQVIGELLFGHGYAAKDAADAVREIGERQRKKYRRAQSDAEAVALRFAREGWKPVGSDMLQANDVKHASALMQTILADWYEFNYATVKK